MNAVLWIRRLALAGALLCFGVVVLGAYVRLTAAGLGCPDWPGCYGHITPLGAEANPHSVAAWSGAPLDVGKAWREMIHRYAASTLGLIVVAIAVLAIRARRTRRVSVGYALLLLATIVFQGILGMLTVTWQLKPLIVTLHLVFGLTTLALLWWLALSLRPRWPSGEHEQTLAAQATTVVRAGAPLTAARRLALVGLLALAVQIALGGWTSSNYAAFACPDFPKCHNAWLPDTDYRDAFVLWRGLGINYEGGVLDTPARVAIHFTHRLGALVATLALALAALVALRAGPKASAPGTHSAARAVLAALTLQVGIGIFMIWQGFPLWLATAHNAGAALLLLATLWLNRTLREGLPLRTLR